MMRNINTINNNKLNIMYCLHDTVNYYPMHYMYSVPRTIIIQQLIFNRQKLIRRSI